MLVSENFMIKVFIQISIPMHILVVGNIESGIVADCTSKKLLVINLIKQEHFKHILKQFCQIFVTETLFVKYLLQKNSLLNICPRNTFVNCRRQTAVRKRTTFSHVFATQTGEQ